MIGLASLVLLAAQAPVTPVTAEDLKGAWVGTLAHAGETTPFALELEPGSDGRVLIRVTLPAAHLNRAAMAKPPLEISGDEAKAGPFRFRLDRAAGTLSGTMPEELAPVYALGFVLRRVPTVEVPPRPEIQAPRVEPVWTFDAQAPLWPGATYAAGAVYVGAEDGRLQALDARTGRSRWAFATGGPLRARPTVSGDRVYLQSDDGHVYALATADGKQIWKARVASKPAERLPFDNPKSRYDRYASGVALAGGRLFLGTNEGRVVALDAATGAEQWAFAAGDAVLATPAVDAGRVYFGSYDGLVYALGADSGGLLWKHDTRKPVVSMPAPDRGVVVIGSRSYDLKGLDAATGQPLWTRYIWSSWVESSATIRDGVAYVGSSDAAAVFAFDAKSGARLWATDVWGWAWAQPAVTADRVYIGSSGQVDYPVGHRGGALALDRRTGRVVWQHVGATPAAGAFGFVGAPDVGAGLAFFTALDGKVYAFAE